MDNFKIFDYTTNKYLNDGEIFSVQENFGDEIKVLRSTNIQDINGKTIFEGDILRFKVFDGWGDSTGYFVNMAVFFVNKELDNGMEITYRVAFKIGVNEEHAIFDIRKDSEIIGNIFENPELLRR